ncbi:hypothetical protein [Sulfitobacter guttiformis]|uniref:Uncharacterized protein n=1 Tax=Sulfitobacter guttiformis TaxID=74349 RepID=A0A420DHB2_9RHOB|nr:hypothetical protein [Sulfitobacter guttiformis]KIN72675.1 hypothetical protein Z949_1853 [Sulfitobacter guttiformis KCTC 32187]RKE93597.1 hypothetical protein C8N30_2674 [Sulfitobacter guttiformis]
MPHDVGSVIFRMDGGATDDVIILGAAFSQIKGDSGTINITAIMPEAGIPSAQFGTLSLEINGTLTPIARGQLMRVPLRLAGQQVELELVCRGANNTQRIDNLFKAKNDEVPEGVEPSLDARRTAPYLLSDVYVDPITHTPSLDPIAGSAAPAVTLYGEGADPDVSTVLGLDIDLTEVPIDEIELTETTEFRHQEWAKVDLGDAFSISVPEAERGTYTPLALKDALATITLDGGYRLLSTNAEFRATAPMRVYTDKKRVDPFTCIITKPEFVEYPLNEIEEMTIEAIVEAVQDRQETLRVDVRAAIQQIGGVSQVTEETSIQNAEKLAETTSSYSYKTYRENPGIGGGTLTRTHWITRYGVNSSVWSRSGEFNPECSASLRAMVRRAARIAIERAHCVTLTAQTFDTAAMTLTLKDRVRIYDARLPSGVAVGKVTGIEVSMVDQASLVTLSLSCPVSDPESLSTAPGGGPDGLASVQINEDITSMSNIVHPPAISAVIGRDASYMVEQMELIDGQVEQELKMGLTDERFVQIEFPDAEMPKTGFSMDLGDLSPVPVENIPPVTIRMGDTIINLPEGITL